MHAARICMTLPLIALMFGGCEHDQEMLELEEAAAEAAGEGQSQRRWGTPGSRNTTHIGNFAFLSGADTTGIEAAGGTGKLVRLRDGTTTASVALYGLEPNETYKVHVHRDACANQAGPHYQDPDACP